VQNNGAGFIVTRDEAAELGLGTVPGLERHIRKYRNGRDLTEAPRGVMVIDAFGLAAEQLRDQYPAVYQRLLDRVKPERDAKGTSKDGAGYAKFWWLHGKPRPEMRKQLANLPRYIATVETAKHRTFQFLDASILPDNKLVAIALSDAFHLGVLSSRLHGAWALAAGSWLGVGNDPVYVKSRCFETFPYPDEYTGMAPELRQRIAGLAEQIDAHRKRVLNPSLRPAKLGSEPDFVGSVALRKDHRPESGSDPNFVAPLHTSDSMALDGAPANFNSPQVGQSGAVGADLVSAASMRPPQSPAVPPAAGEMAGAQASKTTVPTTTGTKAEKSLTLTGLYNVLEALKEQRPLTAKEKQIHTQGLVGVLKELHDKLDAAVLQAYGLSASVTPEDILSHLVTLNQQRAAEETSGAIRWLRPEFQNPQKPASESLSKTELPAHIPRGLKGDLMLETAKPGSEPALRVLQSGVKAVGWPATLPEQVRAVVQVLSASAVPLTRAQIEARFKGKGGWKKGLPALLETLETLGRAQRSVGEDAGYGATWRA
jgi:hypothetical protein